MLEDAVLRVAAVVVAVSGALAVVLKGIRDAWRIGQRVSRILELVETELKPNGGMSLKDQVQQNQRALEELRASQQADESHTVMYEQAQSERDHLIDEVLRGILDRLRALDGGSGGDKFEDVEGIPI